MTRALPAALLVGLSLATPAAADFDLHNPRWFRCEDTPVMPVMRIAVPLTVRTSPATNSPACTLTAGDLLDLGTETDEAVSAMQVAFAWPVTVRLSASCDDGGRVYWVEPYQVFLAAQPGWWVQEMVWGWELGGSR